MSGTNVITISQIIYSHVTNFCPRHSDGLTRIENNWIGCDIQHRKLMSLRCSNLCYHIYGTANSLELIRSD